MKYVIRLADNKFEILAAEPVPAKYIGVCGIDGIVFPTNAYPKLFNDKKEAEKFLSSLIPLYADGASVEEYNDDV